MLTPHTEPHFPTNFPPHATFTSQYSLNYLSTCHKIVPSRQSVLDLQRLADKVPLMDIPALLPEVRTVAIQRCTATLQRARSIPSTHPHQLKSYERYLGLARTGQSLVEQTLNASFTRRLKGVPLGVAHP